MGVIPCDRRDCENIMCDRSSWEFGRICNECFSELEAVRPHDIEAFMETPKRKSNPITEGFDYGKIFPSRRDDDE